VENVEVVTSEIEVPESESAYVKVGSPIRARPNPFSEMEFEGTVTVIDRNVTVQPFGNVIKVIATIRNKDDMLRNGMSGYAKVGGQTMPVWKAFTLTLMRFFNVQVWSWIP
jgi:putative peptide zinc metalloprotease protein